MRNAREPKPRAHVRSDYQFLPWDWPVVNPPTLYGGTKSALECIFPFAPDALPSTGPLALMTRKAILDSISTKQ